MSHSVKLEQVVIVPITLACVTELLAWQSTSLLQLTHQEELLHLKGIYITIEQHVAT